MAGYRLSFLGHPACVLSVVLASTSASGPQYNDEIQRLKAQLPHDVHEVMNHYEQISSFENDEYQRAVARFNKLYACRLDPLPSCLERSDPNYRGKQVFRTMKGPNPLTVVGNLKNWERRNRLHKISVPTLVTVDDDDLVPLPCAETIQNGIRDSQLEPFRESSYYAILEKEDVYIQRIRDFLTEAEKQWSRSDPNKEGLDSSVGRATNC